MNNVKVQHTLYLLLMCLLFTYPQKGICQLSELNAIGLPHHSNDLPVYLNHADVVINAGSKAIVLDQLVDYDFGSVIQSSFLSYDPALDKWQFLAHNPEIIDGVSFSIDQVIFTGLGNNDLLWKYDSTSSTWISCSNFPGPVRSNPSYIVANSKVYIIGGDDVSTIDCWEYDPATDAWSQKNNFPGSLRDYAVSWSLDSIGIFGLGMDFPQGALNDIWKYSPQNDTWIQLNDLPDTFEYNNISFSADGKCFFHLPGRLWAFDPSANSWNQKTPLDSLKGTCFGFGINQTGYVLQAAHALNFYEYNPQSDSWSANFTYQGPYNYYNAWNISGRGISFNHKGYIANSVYDPATDQWSIDSSLADLLFTCNGKAYSLRNDSIEEFDPVLNQWNVKNFPPTNVELHRSLFEINNHSYFQSYDTVANNLYEYDPVSDTWTLKGPMPLNVGNTYYDHGNVSFAIGNKGYFGLGETANPNYDCATDSFFEYDPLLNSWTAKANFPVGGRITAFGVSGTHKGFVGLGVECAGPFDGSDGRMYIYDPVTDEWSLGGSLPARNSALSFSIDGIPYIGGGDERVTQSFSDMWPYNVLGYHLEDWYRIDTAYSHAAHSISGHTFLDVDNNGVLDSSDYLINNIGIHFSPASYYQVAWGGGFEIYSLDSNYHITATAPNGFYFTTPSFYNVFLNNADVSNIDFGIYPDTIRLADVEPVISAVARCNISNTYIIYGENRGLYPANGVVEFTADTQLVFISSTPMPDSIVGNVYYLHYTGLTPFNQQTLASFSFLLPAPGTLLQSSVLMNAIDSLGNIIDTSSAYAFHTAHCSADPNEKMVEPSEDIIVPPGDWLTYTIFFQNTGNDTAFSIMILDTLDDNLDINSLEIIGSSHPVTTDVKWYHVLQFDFENILLPDSNVDVAASQGFITYRIRSLSSVNNLYVRNTANILFDSNSPVNTNTTSSFISDNLPTYVSTTASIKDELKIYPNPANNYFVIDIGDKQQKISDVYLENVMGEKIPVRSYQVSTSEFRVDLPAGIYIVRVTTKDKVYCQRLVIVSN